MEVVYVQAHRGSQSLDYSYYAKHAGAQWRVTFRLDFYPQQSYGKADRWDGSKWQEVFDCSPIRLKLGAYSTGMEPHFWEADAALDAEYMIGMASLVIGDEVLV